MRKQFKKPINIFLLFVLVISLSVLVSDVYADLLGTEGFAIDLSSAGAGLDFTIAFDPTEITGGTTWDDGGDASVAWTWDLVAGDPTITFANSLVTVSTALTSGGTITGSGTFDVTGANPMVLGSGDVTSFTVTTDGTGNAEFTLPNDVIGDADIDWGNGAGQVDLADIPGGTAPAQAFDFSSATVTLPARQAGSSHHITKTLWNPNAMYAEDTQVCLIPILPAAITITNIDVTCDADPDPEIQLDLKWADAFIGLANAAVIDELDTTNGAVSIAAGFDDADIASGKCIYLEWQTEPDSAITQVCVDVTYDYD